MVDPELPKGGFPSRKIVREKSKTYVATPALQSPFGCWTVQGAVDSSGASGKLVNVLALHTSLGLKGGSFAPLDPPLDLPLQHAL